MLMGLKELLNFGTNIERNCTFLFDLFIKDWKSVIYVHLDSIIFLHIHSQEIYINIKTPDFNRLSCLNIDFTVRDIEYEISIFNSFKNI